MANKEQATFDPVDELEFIYNTQIYILSDKVKKNQRLTDSDIKRLLDLTKGVKDLEAIGMGGEGEEDAEARNATVEKLKESLNRPKESKK